MGDNARLDVAAMEGWAVVRFRDTKILDELAILEISDHLREIVAAQEHPRMVLDFSKVTHLSSSALGALLTIHKRVAERGGQLCLACIQPAIYEVFVITRLKEIFRICATVKEAVTGRK